jgi:hypothetical protein
LIINDDRDPVIALDIALQLSKAIPESNLWIMLNFDHSTHQHDSPLGDLFIDTSVNFLSGKWNN